MDTPTSGDPKPVSSRGFLIDFLRGAACATAAVRLENRHVSTSGGNVGEFLTLEKMTEEIRLKKTKMMFFCLTGIDTPWN